MQPKAEEKIIKSTEENWALDIKVFDVGHGDSSLFLFYQNGQIRKSILIDGGYAFNKRYLEEKLREKLPQGTFLDVIIITHFDCDHWRGIKSLVELKKNPLVKADHTIFVTQCQTFLSQKKEEDQEIKKFLKSLTDNFLVFSDHNQILGESIWRIFGRKKTGDGGSTSPKESRPDGAPDLKFIAMNKQVLKKGNGGAPEFTLLHGGSGSNKNQGSISCLIDLNDFYYLTSGDICNFQESGIKTYLEENNIKLAGLKISHHGSATSSSEDFLKMNFSYAVISHASIDGCPYPDVLARIFNSSVQKCYLTNNYDQRTSFKALLPQEDFQNLFRENKTMSLKLSDQLSNCSDLSLPEDILNTQKSLISKIAAFLNEVEVTKIIEPEKLRQLKTELKALLLEVFLSRRDQPTQNHNKDYSKIGNQNDHEEEEKKDQVTPKQQTKDENEDEDEVWKGSNLHNCGEQIVQNHNSNDCEAPNQNENEEKRSVHVTQRQQAATSEDEDEEKKENNMQNLGENGEQNNEKDDLDVVDRDDPNENDNENEKQNKAQKQQPGASEDEDEDEVEEKKENNMQNLGENGEQNNEKDDLDVVDRDDPNENDNENEKQNKAQKQQPGASEDEDEVKKGNNMIQFDENRVPTAEILSRKEMSQSESLMKNFNDLISSITSLLNFFDRFKNKMVVAGDPVIKTSNTSEKKKTGPLKKEPKGTIWIQVESSEDPQVKFTIKYIAKKYGQERKVEDSYLSSQQAEADINAIQIRYKRDAMPLNNGFMVRDDKVLSGDHRDLFRSERVNEIIGEKCLIIFRSKDMGNDLQKTSLQLHHNGNIYKIKYFYMSSQDLTIMRRINL